MFGFVLAEQGHIVPLVYPKNVTGGGNGAVFSLKNYHHATIIIMQGTAAAAITGVQVNQCSAFNGAGATPIPFNVYKCETSDSDVLGARVAVPATGFIPSGNADVFYVIELDGPELDNGGPQNNFVQLVLSNGANAVQATAVAILSGSRFAGVSSPTAIA